MNNELQAERELRRGLQNYLNRVLAEYRQLEAELAWYKRELAAVDMIDAAETRQV